MKRSGYILFLLLFTCSCMRNFDPVTDSDVASYVFDVDVTPMLENIRDWKTGIPIFENGRIPEQYVDFTRLSISIYCYAKDDGKLVGTAQTAVCDFSSPVRLEIPHLSKAAEYSVIATAGFVYVDEYGSMTDRWHSAVTGSYSTFHFQRDTGPSQLSDVLGAVSCDVKYQSGPVWIRIPGLGKECVLHFYDCDLFPKIQLKYLQPLAFSPFVQDFDIVEAWLYTDLLPDKGVTDYYFYVYFIPYAGNSLSLEYTFYSSGSDERGITYDSSVDVSDMDGCEIVIDCKDGQVIEVKKW